MTKNLFTALLFMLAVVIQSSAKDPIKTQNNLWKLVWEDNFEKEGLPNSSIWGYETGYIRNKEAQYYT
ncbi:MAG: hypothetical protein HQ522_08755, partial [Bacteroidetes bacterium]|nr:hypothetical protein [Bacteroidota bacterium]